MGVFVLGPVIARPAVHVLRIGLRLDIRRLKLGEQPMPQERLAAEVQDVVKAVDAGLEALVAARVDVEGITRLDRKRHGQEQRDRAGRQVSNR